MSCSLVCPVTGRIHPGRYTEPVTINLENFILKSAMGRGLPRGLVPLKYRQFVFIGVSDRDFSAGVALAGLPFAQQAFFYARPASGPPWVQTFALRVLPPNPMDCRAEFPNLQFQGSGLRIHLEKGHLEVSHKDSILVLKFGEEPSPLRLCTRTGRAGWTFTRKAAPIPASGYFRTKNFQRELLPSSCRVLTDRTCGLLRRETFWNWAAAATVLPDGRNFGMNLAWGVNETGFTENRIWLDGNPTDLGPVIFDIPEKPSRQDWRVYTEDHSLDLTFHPAGNIAQRFNAGLIATNFLQNTGTFTGRIHLPTFPALDLSAIPGWTEDHYVRW